MASVLLLKTEIALLGCHTVILWNQYYRDCVLFKCLCNEEYIILTVDGWQTNTYLEHASKLSSNDVQIVP